VPRGCLYQKGAVSERASAAKPVAIVLFWDCVIVGLCISRLVH
jgi:hypothetical protein